MKATLGALVVRSISTAGYLKPEAVSVGALPSLRWLPIGDLLIDPTYQSPIVASGRQKVYRIARTFSWSCFPPLVVAAIEGGKFAIIDGQHRATAAAVAGFDKVPCQIVTATREEQATAFKTINGARSPSSRMALQAAAAVASDPSAVRVADICARAQVKLLRYPVPVDRQTPGQTMAVGTVEQCLKRYGEDTLITALQCVTQTKNNRPGALSARLIKALCIVLDRDKIRRDCGLVLLEAFDTIDLLAIQERSLVDAVASSASSVQLMSDKIRTQLDRQFPRRDNEQRAPNVSPPARAPGQTVDGIRCRVAIKRAHRSRRS